MFSKIFLSKSKLVLISSAILISASIPSWAMESQDEDVRNAPNKSHAGLPLLKNKQDNDIIFPRDVLSTIFSFLKPKDLLRVRGVCREWNVLSDDDKLWTPFLSKLGFSIANTVHPKLVLAVILSDQTVNRVIRAVPQEPLYNDTFVELRYNEAIGRKISGLMYESYGYKKDEQNAISFMADLAEEGNLRAIKSEKKFIYGQSFVSQREQLLNQVNETAKKFWGAYRNKTSELKKFIVELLNNDETKSNLNKTIVFITSRQTTGDLHDADLAAGKLYAFSDEIVARVQTDRNFIARYVDLLKP